MRVPMQWMKQYTEIPVSAVAFQDAMIMHGTGVEGLEDQNEAVQNVVVGKTTGRFSGAGIFLGAL